MTTTINKSFHVDHTIEEVWANLSDPNKIVPCVPGAKLTGQVDDNNFKGEVELKFGPVKTKYDGLITFLERDATNKKMMLLGKGLDSKGKGNAEMRMNGQLAEKEGGTDVTVSMELNISGMLAQFGSRLINDASSQVFDQFVNNFKAKLSGGEVSNSLNAGSLAGNVIKGIFGKK